MATNDPLARYKRKRNFGVTSEPVDGGLAGQAARKFVIQKHWASQLHYDLRLEFDGRMLSWAVPKGPSLDAKVKRMAVEVEDHPLAYAGFEGTIPPKQYGAGKVIVWDRGTWQPLGDPGQGHRDGNLKFELHGHKLRGRWALVRIKDRAGGSKKERQPPWLLIKEGDGFARPSSEYSVVDALPDRVADVPAPGAVPCELPATLSPQLATLVDGPPPDAQDWICEIKFDGYRLLTRVDAAGIRLFTRNGLDWTEKLLPLRETLARLNLPPGWYDGELVVPDEHGVPDFGALQRAFEPARSVAIAAQFVLYLFDLPYFDGHDLRRVALESRRALLQQVLAHAPAEQVRLSEAFDGTPQSVIASACKLGLEGAIAKRRGSAYRSGRSGDWIKLKCQQRQEFVVGGYTDPQGEREGIGALLLGVHDAKGALHYAGKVGSGFSRSALRDLGVRLATLGTRACPFSSAAVIEGRPHWVRPVLVAEVSFGDWTRGGHIRHAVFHGLRNDKAGKLIVREKVQSVKTIAKPTAATAAADRAAPALPARQRVTHPDRVIDAHSGTTKLELVRYYGLVGDLMMKHLVGRPVALLRAPAGVGGELFFQKHAQTDKLPGIRQLAPALDRDHPPLLSVAGKQGLLAAAQWNVIEFHTPNNSIKAFEQPDRMVFDLDPGAGVAWPQVQEAAELVRAFLAQLGLTAFLKTSGGKGLHLVVPLRRAHDWDTTKGFSQAIVAHLAKTIAQRFVARSGPKNRVGKIFIDALRNGRGATTVCAWSARARPGLGLSVPVEWSELGSLRGGDHWTVRSAHTRLDIGNDAWRGYAKAARGLSAAMKLLDYRA